MTHEATSQLLEQMRTLEAAVGRGDCAYFRSATTVHHVAITPHFQFYNQDDQCNELSELKVSAYHSDEPQVVFPAPGTALITFRADITGTFKDIQIKSPVIVIETWVQQEDTWLQASYQETPLNHEHGR